MQPASSSLGQSDCNSTEVLDYATIGEEEIGQQILNHLGDGTAVLTRSHGVFTVGNDVHRALRSAMYVEESAEVTHLAALRGAVQPLADDVVALENVDGTDVTMVASTPTSRFTASCRAVESHGPPVPRTADPRPSRKPAYWGRLSAPPTPDYRSPPVRSCQHSPKQGQVRAVMPETPKADWKITPPARPSGVRLGVWRGGHAHVVSTTRSLNWSRNGPREFSFLMKTRDRLPSAAWPQTSTSSTGWTSTRPLELRWHWYNGLVVTTTAKIIHPRGPSDTTEDWLARYWPLIAYAALSACLTASFAGF